MLNLVVWARKTTVELPDSLLAQAKALARERKTTLKQLMQEGLRTVLQRERNPAKPFHLRDGSQRLGQPLVKSWPEIRAIIYDGQGE